MKRLTPEQKARKNELKRKRRAYGPEYEAYIAANRRVKSSEGRNSDLHDRKNEAYRKRMETPEYRAREIADRIEQERRWDDELRVQALEVKRLRVYGLTPEQHATMFEAQGGLCAICKRRRKLVVDHCHETGVVRGLVCNGCNTAIGKLGDTPAGLMRAVKYLRDARKRQQLPLLETDRYPLSSGGNA